MKKPTPPRSIEQVLDDLREGSLDTLSPEDLDLLSGAARAAAKEKRFRVIMECDHPEVTMTTQHPWRESDRYICNCCGISIPANGCGAPTNGFINLRDSDLAVRNTLPPVHFHMSLLQRYAMELPRRFTVDALNEIFAGTPYTAEAILLRDDRRYVVSDPLYESAMDAANSIFRHD